MPTISAIVPARNEEAAIAACVESLAIQPEVAEIIVVNDQSTDKTSEIVRGLITKIPHLRLLEVDEVPPGWVGKNSAAFRGSKAATGPWLLFTDADAELQPGAAARALQKAQETNAALISFSPEQVTLAWYEKALIPFVYSRLAKHYSYEAVNNPAAPAAAANGQFLMIQRDAYHPIGGHSAVAAELLEDVALAKRAKAAGFRLWFGSGQGIVRVRMYRSFGAMWQGWKKNLYLLVGGNARSVFGELESAIPWIPMVLILLGVRFPVVMFLGVCFLLLRQLTYGLELSRNQYPFKFIIYYVPAAVLYAGVLWASYRGYLRGRVEWKGREVAVTLPGARH
ncbi:MAG TPA: glycosyltransferase family 2 protein [Candidatus Acidoferrum sp.]|nr:glycosyltransferase family 2 protein [Candidatus Acidoferrum sp.]